MAETLGALHRAHIAALQLQEGTALANEALRVENNALKRDNDARKRESRCGLVWGGGCLLSVVVVGVVAGVVVVVSFLTWSGEGMLDDNT